jgi:hypothetical protein
VTAQRCNVPAVPGGSGAGRDRVRDADRPRVDRRRSAAAALVLLAASTAGCWGATPAAPMPEPAPGMGPPGPAMVIEITNLGADATLSFRFDSPISSGRGEGLVEACTVTTHDWGPIMGDYALLVDGKVVHEAQVAPGVGDDAHVFVRLQVGRDGGVRVLGPELRAAMPPLGSRPVPGC